jgi:predicted nucleic acid-binding protein
VTAVLDTTAGVEIVTGRPRASALRSLVADADRVLAPTLYVAETTNVFWKYHRFHGLPKAQAERACEHAVDLVDEFVDDRDLRKEAFSLACKTGHPAYDMFFLVLAHRHKAMLATLDGRLATLARKHAVAVWE